MTREELAGIRSSVMDALALFESIWRSTCARKGNGAPSDAEVIVFALAIAQRLKPASEKLHEAAVSLQSTGQVRFDKDALLDVRATILDALAFLKTFRRGPDGEGGNGGIERRRAERTALRVTRRLRAVAAVLGREIADSPDV